MVCYELMIKFAGIKIFREMIDFPCAKINLGLNVTNKRPDGYHDLETVFYPVRLCDRLEFEEVSDSQSVDGCCSLSLDGLSIAGNANDNLGVEYLRAARRLGWSPKVYPVLRVGAGHDGGDHPLYPSASHVRGEIRTGAVVMDNPAFLAYNQRGMLARLRCLEIEDWERIPDCGEGLAQRLYRAVRQGTSLEEAYDLAKTKRYAHARIRRAVLWGALGLREQDRPAQVPYLRVLGANERGLTVLRNLDGSIPVITKPTHAKGIPLMELEARCTDFYALCRETVTPCGAEWSTSPVILQKSGNHV